MDFHCIYYMHGQVTLILQCPLSGISYIERASFIFINLKETHVIDHFKQDSSYSGGEQTECRTSAKLGFCARSSLLHLRMVSSCSQT